MNVKTISLKLQQQLQTMIRGAFAVGLAFSLMACQNEISAQEVDPSKFKPVAQEMNTSSGDKIEVIELFWYGCGHCYALEPGVKNWLKNKPEEADFVKVPAIFSSNLWEFHGKAFYTMKALAAPEQAFDDFFTHLHVKRKQISSLGQLSDFLSTYGLDSDKVSAAFNSFDVDNKVRMAKKLTRQAGITGVPAMVVDGKYMTSQRLAGSTDHMFDVINQLVKKSAAER